MKKQMLVFFMAVLAFAGSATAAQFATSSYQVTGSVVNICEFTSTPSFEFNAISIPAGSFATQVKIWRYKCASPGFVIIYPDSIGNAGQWVFNNGYGKNISTNGGTIYLSMTIDGTPFSAYGNTIWNSGAEQNLSIEAKLTPSGAYTGNFGATNTPTMAY